MLAVVTSCPSCDAAVASDQRYCLSCGARVGERRLDPLALLRERRAAAATPPAAPERPEADSRTHGLNPRTLGASCLGLLLGGALMGAAFAPGPAGSLAAAAQQIVVVTGPVAPVSPAAGGTPAASFAPTGEVVPFDPAPAETAPPAPAAPVPEPPAPVPTVPEETPTPVEPPPKPQSIGHVFLVVLPGGPGAEAAFARDAPAGYLHDELIPRGQLLTGYEPVGTSSLANRIALVSGQEPNPNTEAGCPDYEGCLFDAETKTLADQLSTWNLEWRAYVEGMEEPCRRPDPADPFVYFHSVVDPATCAQSVLPLDHMQDELEKPPVFSLVAPMSDQEPERWIAPILDSKAYRKDGLVVVLFDRAPDALVLSPFVEAGSTNDKAYNHYSLLKTIEDRIGLGEHLGQADDRKVRAFGQDVFDRELDPLQEPEAP